MEARRTMNRTRLALTIKSKIPREIAADRAVGVGAGAGAREIGMEQKTRTDDGSEGRENEREWWDGSSISVGRQASGRWPLSWASEIDDQVGGNPGPDR